MLALSMFAALIFMLALGAPIAFTLASIAIVYAYFLWGVNALNLLVSAAWGGMNNFVLVAVPLFLFMAFVLQKTRIIDDIYETVFKWSGGLPGGLALTTIIVGAILGSVSGVVAAGVIGLTLIGLPQMEKYRYNRRFALGCVLGGGTLGQLLPPNTNMVIYGSVTGVSIVGLFAGGLSAGLLLTLIYIVYALIRVFLNPSFAAPLPLEERVSWKEKFISLKGVIAPIFLVIMTLGAILGGVATPTEAAAFGASGALIIGFVTRRLTWEIIYSCCYETIQVTSMIMWLTIGAIAFSSVFAGIGGNALVANVAANMPGGPNAVFVMFMVIVFFVGMFLEPVSIILLVAPLMSTTLGNLGFNPLWVGLVFNVVLQTSYITPPFGFSIFYVRGSLPEGTDIDVMEIFRSAFPIILLQLVGAVLIFTFPQLVMWLPAQVMR